MRQVVQFLHFASRGLAVCAVLAGLAPGLLAVFTAGFICADSCGQREVLVSHLGPGALRGLTPCAVLEALAVAAFLAYCLATRQARRAIIALLFLLVGGLVGVAALGAVMQQAATLPVGDAGFLIQGPAEAWATRWGLALTLVPGAWSGVLAYLQWGR